MSDETISKSSTETNEGASEPQASRKNKSVSEFLTDLGSLNALKEQKAECEGEDGDEIVAPVKALKANVANELARALIDATISGKLRRRLDVGDPVCVCLTVPGIDWRRPIADALRTRWSNASIVARDG